MAKSKKSWVKRLKRIGRVLFFILLTIFIVGLVAIELFDRYLSSDGGTKRYYSKAPYEVNIHRTGSGVRYLEMGDADKPPLILLHGSPGSILDWKSMVTDASVYTQYRLIIVERPGYGSTKPRKAEASIRVQAERCLEVMQDESAPALIMGYSYGAPVALAMAALAPEQFSKVIGVSGQYDPDNEIVFRISHFIKFGVFRYLLPRWFWVSNVEKLAHQASLRDVLPLFDQVNCEVHLMHGNADTIVPYKNSPWLQERLGNRPTLQTLHDIDHGVPFGHMSILIEAVLSAR